jgi:hypothetical protein
MQMPQVFLNRKRIIPALKLFPAIGWEVGRLSSAQRNRPRHVESSAAPAEDFAGWKARALAGLNKIAHNLARRHDLLTLVVMVVITCVSIVWGLATLDCPIGKDRWGACNPPPQDSALRQETTEFIRNLFMRP